jgi:hypothetical protein
MEGSLAMVDAEAVDDDAPVLGARRTQRHCKHSRQ